MIVDLKEWIIQSRLGSCWKCMTFAGGMLLVSVAACFMTVRWRSLETDVDTASSAYAVEIAAVSTGLFAILCLAHLVALVLKKSIWRRPSVLPIARKDA